MRIGKTETKKAEPEFGEARERNKRHREKIISDIRTALMSKAMLNDAQAGQVIFSLIQKEIPHCTVEF